MIYCKKRHKENLQCITSKYSMFDFNYIMLHSFAIIERYVNIIFSAGTQSPKSTPVVFKNRKNKGKQRADYRTTIEEETDDADTRNDNNTCK